MSPPQPNLEHGLGDLDTSIDNRSDWGMPKDLIRAENNRGNIHQDVDNSKNKNLLMPWFVLLALVAAYSAGVSTSLMLESIGNRADQTATKLETKQVITEKVEPLQQSNDMLIYYVMELDGKLMQRKLIKPEESWAAQQLQRAKQKIKASEKESERNL